LAASVFGAEAVILHAAEQQPGRVQKKGISETTWTTAAANRRHPNRRRRMHANAPQGQDACEFEHEDSAWIFAQGTA
jgi:hypothetical protein